MRRCLPLLALGALLAAPPAVAQLGLPPLGLPPVGVPDLLLRDTIDGARQSVVDISRQLTAARLERTERLLRQFPDLIELDARGDLAKQGELLLIDPDPATIRAAQEAGFVLSGSERLDSLGLTLSSLALPRGLSLKQGETLLLRLAPNAQIATDTLHFQTGAAPLPMLSAAAAARGPGVATPVGIIDGAPAQAVGSVRGFAKGAPTASNHGSAVASLLASAGVRNIRVADVYGIDPAGGNALAIVRALDWLIGGGAKVISISLAGPRNPVVGKAISAAQGGGTVIVAAVGNDGPAAPPAYPASYPGVVAVTAVDGRNRPLIEAGRATHLDYAAPGAGILALNKAGRKAPVRGTSYAVPLVAARAARALDSGTAWRLALDQEAVDLGRKGPDDQFGRGLLCRGCGR